jgi:hypothetical protein
MGQNHFQEANSCSASQKIFLLLWNPQVIYRVHKSSPLDPLLRKTNAVHILTPSFFNTEFELGPLACSDSEFDS